MGVLVMRARPLQPSRSRGGRRPCAVSLAPVSFLRPSWIQPGSSLLSLLCTHSGQPHGDLDWTHEEDKSLQTHLSPCPRRCWEDPNPRSLKVRFSDLPFAPSPPIHCSAQLYSLCVPVCHGSAFTKASISAPHCLPSTRAPIMHQASSHCGKDPSAWLWRSSGPSIIPVPPHVRALALLVDTSL